MQEYNEVIFQEDLKKVLIFLTRIGITCAIKVEGKFNNTSIISAFAATNDAAVV